MKTSENKVKTMLQLKADYKSVSGQDWKPDQSPPAVPAQKVSGEDIGANITDAEHKVLEFKNSKAAKSDAAVKTLLQLKADYKSVSGQDWKPDQSPPAVPAQKVSGEDIGANITDAEHKVLEFKNSKAAKSDAAVKTLLQLKADYKSVSGQDWKPDQSPPAVPAQKVSGEDIGANITDAEHKVLEFKNSKAAKIANCPVPANIKVETAEDTVFADPKDLNRKDEDRVINLEKRIKLVEDRVEKINQQIAKCPVVPGKKEWVSKRLRRRARKALKRSHPPGAEQCSQTPQCEGAHSSK
ncbi:bifunctional glutamate/proline--tRNA ligase-like [Physella acuta]|uniref:bifunctional glutamate/proline--tRNA ligase-like n=1 Tax=Physella acuta TaxID=109671 RepID=UPI0027DAD94F|nr:bifunctional glutamate/proline--tRNA ligase-like [Physella acuta]